jgi:hypothetical protein
MWAKAYPPALCEYNERDATVPTPARDNNVEKNRYHEKNPYQLGFARQRPPKQN